MNCKSVLGDLVSQMNLFLRKYLRREKETFGPSHANEMWGFLGSVVCDLIFKYSYHPYEFCYSMPQVRNTMSAQQCSLILAWFSA